MITIDTVCVEIGGIGREEVELWIERAWVRPDGEKPRYLFRPIDVARVRLIHELRDALHVNEEAVPVVLSLLDQLHDERRRLRRVRDALAAVPAEWRDAVLRGLADADG